MRDTQYYIHLFELGAGSRVIRNIFILVSFLVLVFTYDFRSYKNFASEEAMETAQLGKNLSEGKGYTTYSIRPLSFALIREHKNITDKNAVSQLLLNHPDIQNAPLYPLFLAAVLKLSPFHNTHLDVYSEDYFTRYLPEVWISCCNQFIMIGSLFLFYYLARLLFDQLFALFSTVVLLVTESIWKFSVSGLSTTFLTFLFLGLCVLLALLLKERRRTVHVWMLGIGCGVILGLLFLTRYSFGLLLLPVLVMVGNAKIANKSAILGLIAGIFLLIATPWCVRNYMWSGHLFGTAGYSMAAGGQNGDALERTLNPENYAITSTIFDFLKKIAVNFKDLIQDDLLKVGGTFMAGLCLSGYLISYANPLVGRMKVFSGLVLGVLVIAQALGKTHVSVDMPIYNTENLLGAIYPLITLFGCAFFWVMLERMELPAPEAKILIHGALLVVVALPLASALMSRPFAIAGSANPPVIGTFANWFRTDNLLMSDTPSGMAWYGRRPCLWLTADSQKDFLAFYDGYRVIDGVYLSSRTLDRHLVTEMVGDRPKDQRGWGMLVMQILQRGTIPRDFPLQKAFAEFMPNQLLLVDWERWKDSTRKE